MSASSLQEFIGQVAGASYKSVSTALYAMGIVALFALHWLAGVLFVTPVVSSFRLVFPPFENAGSFLSLLRDPSLVPPYGLKPNDANDEDKSGTETEPFLPNARDGKKGVVSGTEITHFFFIVHGYQGLGIDLSYLETVIKQACREQIGNSGNGSSYSSQETADVDDDDFVLVSETAPIDGESSRSSLRSEQKRRKLCDVVVHTALCNERRTGDGVINGGDRLITEIREVVDTEMKRRHPEPESGAVTTSENEKQRPPRSITISILGNSMGGLYGRYAIAKLISRHCVEEEAKDTKANPSWILDGRYKLGLNLFCTTASPHLGVSEHTWIRVPRLAELCIAFTMGQTGSDLFRTNGLLYAMATEAAFLEPLAAFRKRVACANCYGTDFPVPVETAAFLSEASGVPHRKLPEDEVCRTGRTNGAIVATLSTSPGPEDGGDERAESCRIPPPRGGRSEELHQMSVALDKLGWKKVFVDLRKEMFSIELPGSLRTTQGRRSRSDDEGVVGLGEIGGDQAIPSRDVVGAIERLARDDDNGGGDRLTLRVPTGHNMIVAFSRDRFASFLNRGGRSLVNELGTELAREMLEWESDGC